LGSKLVDTSDSDNESNLSFSGNVEGVFSSGLSSKGDEVLLFLLGGFVVLLASLGIFLISSFSRFLSLGDESLSGFSELGVSGSLLQQSFGDVFLPV